MGGRELSGWTPESNGDYIGTGVNEGYLWRSDGQGGFQSYLLSNGVFWWRPDGAGGWYEAFDPAAGSKLTSDGNGGWVLEDLGSTNGTYLDRTKVTGPTPVAVGVPIRIGRTVLELRP